jgi:hypothetical protein
MKPEGFFITTQILSPLKVSVIMLIAIHTKTIAFLIADLLLKALYLSRVNLLLLVLA